MQITKTPHACRLLIFYFDNMGAQCPGPSCSKLTTSLADCNVPTFCMIYHDDHSYGVQTHRIIYSIFFTRFQSISLSKQKQYIPWGHLAVWHRLTKINGRCLSLSVCPSVVHLSVRLCLSVGQYVCLSVGLYTSHLAVREDLLIIQCHL